MSPSNGGEREPPYPSGSDFVPYREFLQWTDRVKLMEQRQIGETLVRLEERQNQQGQRLAAVESTVVRIDENVEKLQSSETQRAGFRIGTKELVLMLGATVAILGTIITAAVAILQLGQ